MNDRQRLEAVVDVVRSYLPPDGISREEAMSQIIALVDPLPAQPEQKPVAWLEYDDEGYLFLSGNRKGAFPVFIAPPIKPWVSLTDEECDEIWGECLGVFDCLKMTEAKLREKNT